jgi:hypothetical protein
MDKVGKGKRLPERLNSESEAELPLLSKFGYNVTSFETTRYNCVAYAAGDETKKWDPTGFPSPSYYWPPNAKRGDEVNSLESCFEEIGFKKCYNGDLEHGYEKIAIYAKDDGNWTHVAKQLSDGAWSSKLGDFEDIRHQKCQWLHSHVYGQVVSFMRRSK